MSRLTSLEGGTSASPAGLKAKREVSMFLSGQYVRGAQSREASPTFRLKHHAEEPSKSGVVTLNRTSIELFLVGPFLTLLFQMKGGKSDKLKC